MLAVQPFQAVNAGLRLTDLPIPQLSADELEVATANVAAWGGHPALFRHFLAVGLAATPVPEAHHLAAIAGWRAGALSLRFEALRLLPTLPSPAVAATLGFAASELADFAELQQLDPYWWPGRMAVGGQVLRAGGFAGLGGPWLAPPVRAGRAAISGRWVVLSGESWWQLDADVFGAVLTELDAEPECGPDTDPSGVRINVSPDSYVVGLNVPAEATGAGGE
ncbi:MAG: hypothetical protein KIT69_09595 [Propionibacteriaceae bacterium]|nr:hypothetical protein [Propionibacteriaceae bacterium]